MEFHVSEEDKNRWQKDRWTKDNISKLLQKDGFTLKLHGRSGFIYFVERNTFVELYVEISGVAEYDLLIYFEKEIERYPNRILLEQEEKSRLKTELIKWLKEKKIKSDL